ncbi:MAG TPA: EcoRI family type II restriction endonuclease [Solirubrobacterales bacterium]|jgi:type II restriction enzyme|nr:EcoRI family type II restriction endonuclease [Solirubrobacterales bacterium]
MAEKHRLRLNRAGTIINLTSRQQETALGGALKVTTAELLDQFGLELTHKKRWKLTDIVSRLSADFPDIDFYTPSAQASMNPDGGILSITDHDGIEYPILISEVKNQGTNDLRAAEGKKPQAKGNAIERLGKNVIGIRAAMLSEGIVPFVCFGYGVDFDEGSSILDRVATIAMYGSLNKIYVVNAGTQDQFNRGSFFFRGPEWSEAEMTQILIEIGTRSIHYYFAKYGESYFAKAAGAENGDA